jgi:hypothetical protein
MAEVERKQAVICNASSSLAIFQFLSILPTNVFIEFIHLIVTRSPFPPPPTVHDSHSPMQHNWMVYCIHTITFSDV